MLGDGRVSDVAGAGLDEDLAHEEQAEDSFEAGDVEADGLREGGEGYVPVEGDGGVDLEFEDDA